MNTKLLLLSVFVLTLFLSISIPQEAEGKTVTCCNKPSSFWSDPTIWNGGIPESGDDIIIKNNGGSSLTPTVELDTDFTLTGNLTIDGSFVRLKIGLESTLSTTISGTITISNDGTIENNGKINNHGLINIDDGMFDTNFNSITNNHGLINNDDLIRIGPGLAPIFKGGIFNNEMTGIINNNGRIIFGGISDPELVGIFNNKGSLNNEGSTSNGGNFTNHISGIINNKNIFTTGFNFSNLGLIENENLFENIHQFTNKGIINNHLTGNFVNLGTSFFFPFNFVNEGIINNYGIIKNGPPLIGPFKVNFVNGFNGMIENYGHIENNGKIINLEDES